MISISNLVNFFLLGLTLLCLILVLLLASSQRMRIWYTLFILSFIGWIPTFLRSMQPTLWLWVLPVFWLVGTLIVGFSGIPLRVFPPQLKEPSYTQESLQGRKGTLNALRLYYTLLLIILIVTLLFCSLPAFYHW